jgi:repressor LexA
MRPVNESKINEVLAFIRNYQTSEAKTPTYRQIMKQCKIASLKTVANYVSRLKERGLIEFSNENGWNQIKLPDYLKPSVSHPSYIVGTVHCGPPTEAVECIEACVSLPNEIFGDGEHTLIRAKGDSMINQASLAGRVFEKSDLSRHFYSSKEVIE